MRSRLARFWRHLWIGDWQLRRAFTGPVLDAIEASIGAGERRHGAELRFVVEARLAPRAVLTGISPRDRAAALFSELGVWETEHNNGVLVYVLFADRAVEIVADRGARARIDPVVWEAACATMTSAFARSSFRDGCLRAIEQLNDALAGAFPPGPDNPDELPNRPFLR